MHSLTYHAISSSAFSLWSNRAWMPRIATMTLGVYKEYRHVVVSEIGRNHVNIMASHANLQGSRSRCPGGWFCIKMPSYQYRKSHCGDKTILRPSYLHNRFSYTGKMAFFILNQGPSVCEMLSILSITYLLWYLYFVIHGTRFLVYETQCLPLNRSSFDYGDVSIRL